MLPRLRCLAIATAMAASLPAQGGRHDGSDHQLSCNDTHGDRPGACEIKEFRVPAGPITVDGRSNGGITVKGTSQGDILVRARIQTYADSEADARQLLGQIRVETKGEIRAEAPTGEEGRQWSVSYEILTPNKTDLTLRTKNGGIRIADVRGNIEFQARNGGVSLSRLGGKVHGQTTNGGLQLELAGDRWDGEGLDARTTNGGVHLEVPERYSARLETSTVNGRVHSDFAVTGDGHANRQVSVNLGSGGATLRATTINGGVHIQRK